MLHLIFGPMGATGNQSWDFCLWLLRLLPVIRQKYFQWSILDVDVDVKPLRDKSSLGCFARRDRMAIEQLKRNATDKSAKLFYFEWSPPWHVGWRLSGEGCHWEYDGKNGEFENIDFRFPWLSDTSEMGFGHDVPFLNYSDRLPHPSDLCQPDRVRWG